MARSWSLEMQKIVARGQIGTIAVSLLLGTTLASGIGLQAWAKVSEFTVAPAELESRLKQTRSQAYTNAMLAGYAAAERKDYQTALINFRRALAARPGDRYASAGIRNMETYSAQERAEAAKQAEIARLETILPRAVAASDWACAAASVDRLIELVPPNSADRARLIAYRGELTGLIQSRANLDQWSTVCPGGQV
jgi:tetratricopeptide (TPR) repeat protein